MKKLLLFLIVSNPILTFSQVLDPTFGSNKGIIYNQFSTSNTDDLVSSAALQSDGNIIIVGSTSEYGYTGFISRVYPTGSIDTSFNKGGYKLISSGPQEALAIQSDGKILVAGRMVLTRLNSDGSNDTTFNNSGNITLSLNGYNMKIKTLSILTNGKIMATGYVSNGTDNDFVLVRLNTNGTLDTSFDLDGISTLKLLGSNETLFATGIQTDGKIVIAGRRGITTQSTTDYIIARFNSTGSLDTSFGTNGLVTSTTGIQSLDFQSDGKIVTAGGGDNSSSTTTYSTTTSSTSLYAKRYNTDGSVDTAFNVIKTAYRTSNTYQKPQIKCLKSGKILLSGTYTNSSMANHEFALNQFNSNGTVDTSFSATGTVYLGAGISNTSINSLSSFLIVKPDGKILTGGSVYSNTSTKGENFRIEFIQTSSTGVMEYFHDLNLKQGVDYIDSVIEQPSGKTVATVFSKIGYSSIATLLIRYNQNGTIDNSFGNIGDGIVYLVGVPCSMKQQLDGKILISITNPDNSISIYRFLMDGVLDTSFGQANVGFVTLLDGYAIGRRGVDIVVSNEGSIYVANRYMRNSYGVIKLNYDGSVDTSYGDNGTASTRFDFYSNTESEYPMNLILNPDNSVVVTGVLSNGQPEDANYMVATGIVKFNKFGIIDNAFGVNGKIILENINYIYSNDFLADANSNLYLSSIIKGGSITTKLSSNGIIDTTYGTNGVVTSSYFSGSMFMEPDGKIMKTNSINSQFAITRYNINGTLDTTFGTAGFIKTPIYYSSSISKILLLSSGKLLAVGNSFNGSNSIMAMARYTNLNLGTLDFTKNDTNFMVYPNPIEESATFSYSLKDATAVTIEIIDLQGKVVQTVLNSKEQQSGEYQQEILLHNSVASGNYILLFSSPQGNQAIKIIKK